jgi:hypothetical protein
MRGLLPGTSGLLLVVGLHVVSTVEVTCIRGATNYCSNRSNEKSIKAMVSTHPKYSQDLHQIYTRYASVSKKWGNICGLNYRNARIRGEKLILSKTTSFSCRREEHIWYHIAHIYSNNLPRDPLLVSLEESDLWGYLSIIWVCFIKYPVLVIRGQDTTPSHPITMDTAIRIDYFPAGVRHITRYAQLPLAGHTFLGNAQPRIIDAT